MRYDPRDANWTLVHGHTSADGVSMHDDLEAHFALDVGRS